jgi:hypothetical protein
MNIDNFEEQAKNLFADERIPTDNNTIWNNIEPKLKKKKKRRWFLIFFLSIGMLAVGLFGLFKKKRYEKPIVKQQEIIVDTKAITPVLPIAQLPVVISIENVNNTSTIKAAQNSTEIDIKPSYSTSSFNISAKKAKNEEQKQTSEVISPLETEESVLTNVTSITTLSPEQKLKKIVPNSQVTTKNPPVETDKVVDQSAHLSPEKIIIPTPISVDKIDKKTTEKQPEISEKVTKKDDKKKKRDKNDWKRNWSLRSPDQQFSIEGGPSYAIQFLSSNSGLSNSLLSNRRRSETSLEAFNFGMMYGVSPSKNNVFWKIGFNYHQNTVRFKDTYVTETTETVYGVISETYDFSGAIIGQTMGQKERITTTELIEKAYNVGKYFSIPFGVGVQQKHRNVTTEISGGLDWNFAYRYKGQIFHENATIVDLRYGQNLYRQTLKSKTGLGVWGGYTLSHTWKSNSKWFLGGNIMLPLRSVSHSDYRIKERFVFIDFKTGVVFDIYGN